MLSFWDKVFMKCVYIFMGLLIVFIVSFISYDFYMECTDNSYVSRIDNNNNDIGSFNYISTFVPSAR